MRSSLHRSDPGRLVETRRRGALAAAILALLSVAAPAPFDPRVVRASAADQKIVQAFHDYQFGEASLAQGNLRRASRYFGKALDLFPPFPEAHLGKGRIALAERRFEDALHEFEAARDSYSAAGGSLYDLRLVRYTDARKKAAEVRQLLTGIQSKLSFAGASNGTNQNDPGLHDHMIGSLAVRSFATETGRQMNLLEEQLAPGCLDGRVARMTGTGSAFGVQLDSLVDIISFGVAPACLVYFWGLQPYDRVGLVVAGMLMLAGAFRLARFNVTADGKAHRFSQGLTITMGGGTVSSLVMWHAGSGLGPPENPFGIVTFVVLVAFLEVSSVPYRTMKSLRLSPRTLAGVVVVGGACLAVGAVYDISTVLVILGLIHVGSGPIEHAATWPRRRRSRRAEAAAARERARKDRKDE